MPKGLTKKPSRKMMKRKTIKVKKATKPMVKKLGRKRK